MTRPEDKKKNIILFAHGCTLSHIEQIRELEKIRNQKYRIAIITNQRRVIPQSVLSQVDILIRCNTLRTDLVDQALKKYKDEIACILSRYENSMVLYTRLISLFPYLKLPTAESIHIANDKIEMRKAFLKHNPKITPKFVVVKNATKEAAKKITKEVGLPCVIKPANLSKSQLVIACYYKAELEANLKLVYKKVKQLYKKNKVERSPQIIAEELMEGQMYSIDAYVNSHGDLFYTPAIEITTGKDSGYDDFFMFKQITPSILSPLETEKAQYVVKEATHALGLRSSTVHAELMKTEKRWKIIELGARPGGYRDELLQNSFRILHTSNDILIHLGKKPIIKRTVRNHTCLIKFFPKKPGKLKAIKGLKNLKKLKYVIKLRQGKKVGEFAGLSKNGHNFVLSLTITGKTRSELLGNIRKVEKLIEIKTASK